MVQLIFNVYGFAFQSGLEMLVRSYNASWSALAGDVERAADDAFGYQQALEQGAEVIGERDGDGHIVWSHEEELAHNHRVAEDALRTLRRAYVISMYHHWERGARTWTGAKQSLSHDQLAAKVADLGLQLHPKLAVVRIVANLLKHDNDIWGHRLLAVAPELVDEDQASRGFVMGWYDKVMITENQMTEFFNAVAESGPKVKTVFA